MAKNKTIRFVDSVAFQPVFSQELKDFMQNSQGQVSSLRVRIAATHAGKITRNNGFYLPHKMRTSAASFTAQYPKPIQVHHDTLKDPVGRVVEARYVDISGGIMDAWNQRNVKDFIHPIQDDQLQKFCDGSLSHNDIIDVANKYFIQDSSIVDDPDYQGLGYIELVADITDPDAIRKILDRRYLTGSVGASTDSATCSICKTDWATEDGPCEHRPGKIYDGQKCVIIAGDLDYDEWSFVNAPADRHSTVIEFESGGVRDSVVMEDSFASRQEEVRMEILDHTQELVQEEKSKEETKMNKDVEDKTQEVSSAPAAEDVKDETVVSTEEPQVEDATDSAQSVETPPVEVKDEQVEDEKIEEKKEDATKPSNLLDEFIDEDLIRFFGALKQAMEERNLPTEGSVEENAEDSTQEMSVTETGDSEDSMVATETVDTLKAEVAKLMEDVILLNDQLADLLKSNKELKLQKVKDLAVLAGFQVQIQDDASVDDVDKILNDLAGKVDIAKIADKINSGLSNEPQGTVENPVLIADKNSSDIQDVVKVDRKILEQIQANYLALRFQSQVKADQYLADLKARNILPQGKFEIEDKS